MITRRAWVAILLTASVLMTGCAADATPAEAPAAEAPAAEETPTPTPVATEPVRPVEDPADPSTWLIAFDHLGPIVFGDPVATPAGTPYDGEMDPEGCVGVLNLISSEYPTVLVNHRASSTVTNYTLTTIPDPAEFADTTPRTAEGIGIGSAVADVLAAYPGAQLGEGSPGVRYISVTDGSTWIDFTIIFDVVQSIHVLDGPTPPHENCG